jgi:DNA polymerase I-like protein with 3'-5' exonuclease and polymerase domains
MSIVAIDIETDIDTGDIQLVGLATKTGETKAVVNELRHLSSIVLRVIKEGDTVVGHNASRFDFPVLKDKWGTDLIKYFSVKGVMFVDTLLFSQMLFPDRPSHSLASWGETLGFEKWEVDFKTATPEELSKYCLRDCELTLKLYEHLVQHAKRLGGKWKHALKVEATVADIIEQQVRRRVRYDREASTEVYTKLKLRQKELEEKIDPDLPVLGLSESKLHHPPKKQFKKDGTPSELLLKYLSKYSWAIQKEGLGWVAVGPGKKRTLPLKAPLVTEAKITLGQQELLKHWLLAEGWTPTQWNWKNKDGKKVKTSPRLTDKVTKEPCPGLMKLHFGGVATLISEWLVVRSRLSAISTDKGTGWHNACTEEDPYIASDAFTCGTPTARFRHKGIVNVPRVSTPYGKEMRSLFVPREGMVMVGWDASSLEACMEGHYTYAYDEGAYAKELLEGDVHTVNMEALGLPNRDAAKIFKYAATYGARPPKLAESLSVPLPVASRWFTDFWAVNASLQHLNDDLLKEWESYGRKYLVGLDGRLIFTRYKHALLNTKFQSAGAIVMKHSMLIAHRLIKKEFKEDAYGLIRYHDEEQWECAPDIASRVGELGVQSIAMAGQFLGVRVPLTGEYKIGKSWAETH